MRVSPSYYPSRARCRYAAALLLCLWGAACSSSSTTVTSPSAGRCGVSLAASPTSVDAAGGNGLVNVSIDRDCTWDAHADADWIALSAPTSGQGSGTVRFTASPNQLASPRSGAVVVNDQRVSVAQAAASCRYDLSDSGGRVPAAGGTLAVTVTAQPGCRWTAASQVEWVRIDQGREGSGDGAVAIVVTPNGGQPREATIVIAGRQYLVSQDGTSSDPTPGPTPPTPGCQYNLSPSTVSFDSAGGEGTVTVGASSSACAWGAVSSVPWIMVVTTGGNGSGTVRYTVAANPATAERTGTLTIAGALVRVSQAAAAAPACGFEVSPVTVSVGTAGNEDNIRVTATAPSCTWTAVSNVSWITVGTGSGAGSGNVRYTVAANTGSQRTGTLTVAGTAVSFTQAAAAPTCQLEVSPQTVSVGAAGNEDNIRVTASASSCGWTAVSNAPWITVGTASGSGSGNVRYTVAANTGGARTGTLTVAGVTVTVTQAAAPPCTFTVSPQSQSFPVDGGEGRVSVDASASSCAWTATTTATWITITAGGGSGDADVRYQVAANTGAARTATLMVAGVAVMVSQAAAPAPGSVVITGRISGLSGNCPAISFTVEGRLVHTNAATVFEDRCDRIRDRDNLTVTGLNQADGSVLAQRVREN
jgi:hypothetical protein